MQVAAVDREEAGIAQGAGAPRIVNGHEVQVVPQHPVAECQPGAGQRDRGRSAVGGLDYLVND